MESLKESFGFLTPFKLKANLFKQPGNFAKYVALQQLILRV